MATSEGAQAWASGEDDRRSLGRLAYERFKEALFERRIQPGAFMTQAELVATVGVPLGPLREALQLLQAEGLVTIKARAGIEIARPDYALVRNTYQLRLILERAAIRQFAETASAEMLATAERQHIEMIDRVSGRDLTREEAKAVEALDFGFHLEVIGSLANPLATRAYRQTHDYIQLIRLDRHYGLSAPVVIRTMTEHLVIIRACRTRDTATAEAALETHFAKAMQRAMGL